MFVGYTPGFTGIFSQSGGAVTINTNLVVGDSTGGAVGAPSISGGILNVTNAAHTALLDVRNGQFMLSGGTVAADRVMLTNGSNSSLQLGGGVLNGGNLTIGPGSTLTGNGTVGGPVVNGGNILGDAAGLTFTGAVTNNGVIIASNGAPLVFYGPVVNNGTINATNGSLRFLSTFQNNGTVLYPAAGTNAWISSSSGKWETSTNWSLGLPGPVQSLLITNPSTKTVTVDATTAASFPATMTVSNLTISAPAGSTNTLFLNNAGPGTPLQVSSTFDDPAGRDGHPGKDATRHLSRSQRLNRARVKPGNHD